MRYEGGPQGNMRIVSWGPFAIIGGRCHECGHCMTKHELRADLDLSKPGQKCGLCKCPQFRVLSHGGGTPEVLLRKLCAYGTGNELASYAVMRSCQGEEELAIMLTRDGPSRPFYVCRHHLHEQKDRGVRIHQTS